MTPRERGTAAAGHTNTKLLQDPRDTKGTEGHTGHGGIERDTRRQKDRRARGGYKRHQEDRRATRGDRSGPQGHRDPTEGRGMEMESPPGEGRGGAY
jgi:hypothetical protein